MSVLNYHFLRACNFSCKFCFHTALNKRVAKIEDAKDALNKFKNIGIERVNLSGGEPFFHPKFVGDILTYAKSINMKTSVISNGSLLNEKWFEKYGNILDVLGISCDSFNLDIQQKIGRISKNGNQVDLTKINELTDETDLKGELACAGGACEITESTAIAAG